MLNLQDCIAEHGGLLRIFLTHFTADHHVDQPLTIHLRDRERIDVLAVAQDADVVAQVKDFVKTVRDIDDRDAFRAQLLDDAEHDFQLTVGQNGRRLIHDQNLGIVVDGVHDLDDLFFCHGQRRDLRVDVDVHAEIVDDLLRTAAHTGPVNKSALHHHVAKEHIFRNGQWLGQLDFLMHDADAGAARLDGAREVACLTFQNDFAGVWLVDTGKNLDKRGLARAVLTDKAVNRAAFDVNGNVIECLDAGELFRDAVQRKNIIVHIHPTFLC